jgi:hypothetical protein
MRRPASKTLRWSLAVLVGVPGTLLFVPIAAFIAYSGSASAIEALRGGPWSHSPSPTVGLGLLYLGWGVAGLLGLLGFWSWVLQPAWAGTAIGRWFVTSFVALGIAAMVPVARALTYNPIQVSVLSMFALLGITTGLFVLYHQLSAASSASSTGKKNV